MAKESHLLDLIEWFRKFESLTNARCSDFIWHLESLQTLWKLCPFKVGDRVQLAKTPVITAKESWGWMGAKHFLLAGAKATVREREFYDAAFMLGLVFDDDSWLDLDGVRHPYAEKDRRLFTFGARWVQPLTDGVSHVCEGAPI